MRPVYLLAALPFIGILVGILFANRVEPFVLGLPFILFWIVMWVILSSGIMAIVYALDPANKDGDQGLDAGRLRVLLRG